MIASIINKNVPEPCDTQVQYFLAKWNETPSYSIKEEALNRLFHQICPKNNDIESILLKASVLNDFYSTNIYSVFPIANRILSLNIDER